MNKIRIVLADNSPFSVRFLKKTNNRAASPSMLYGDSLTTLKILFNPFITSISTDFEILMNSGNHKENN